jgi:hypothetical protein
MHNFKKSWPKRPEDFGGERKEKLRLEHWSHIPGVQSRPRPRGDVKNYHHVDMGSCGAILRKERVVRPLQGITMFPFISWPSRSNQACRARSLMQIISGGGNG